jgi:hypothetical protein
MTLLPEGVMDDLVKPIWNQIISQFPPEMVEELREAFAEFMGWVKERLPDMMAKHYTIEEIVGLARFMASAEGQAGISKQPLMSAEFMELSQREMLRILTNRYPLFFTNEDFNKLFTPMTSLPPVEVRDAALVQRKSRRITHNQPRSNRPRNSG